MNYQGARFHIKEVIGDLERDPRSGRPLLKKDAPTGRFWDKQGREVNKRGYLVDRKGNVVNSLGHKMFRKVELTDDGEIPKIFDFCKFNPDDVTGSFDRDENGNPILMGDKKLPKG